jgi:hypothetical protein
MVATWRGCVATPQQRFVSCSHLRVQAMGGATSLSGLRYAMLYWAVPWNLGYNQRAQIHGLVFASFSAPRYAALSVGACGADLYACAPGRGRRTSH